MTTDGVTVKVKMTPTQAGKLLMKSYALRGEVKELKRLISVAVDRLSMPIKQIRGDGFSDMMGELRSINDDIEDGE